MIKNRLVAVIIVDDQKVVQSERFVHTHVIHYDAIHAVESFSRWDVDEIVILNVSKSRSSQNDFLKLIERVSTSCFVPLTVGGFVDNESYAAELIASGADKLSINTAFFTAPHVPLAISDQFGRQCVVASIDVKATVSEQRSVHINRGRRNLEQPLEKWVAWCERWGAGEILLNSIDHDGNRGGYDLHAVSCVRQITALPIILFGGAFSNKDFADGLDAGASAVAAANIFHYKEMATKQVKRYLKAHGYNVRSQ